MTRKTKREAAITRERLLDAAERVFRERGVTNTTLAEVAAAAGYTRGAVYWHFKDKAHLIAAMCERATLPLDTMRADIDVTTDDPLGTLRRLMVEALLHLATDPRARAVFEVIFLESERWGELNTVHRRRDRCDSLARIERLMRRAVVLRQLPPDTDAVLAAKLLQACIGGLLHAWLLDRPSYDLAGVAPSLVECVVAGIAACPPRLLERVGP